MAIVVAFAQVAPGELRDLVEAEGGAVRAVHQKPGAAHETPDRKVGLSRA